MYWPVIGAGRCIPLSGSALKAWAALGQRWRFAALQGQAVGKVRNLSESFHGMLFCGGVLRSLRRTHLSLQGSWCQAGTSAPHGVPVPYPLGLGMWVARPTTLSEGWKSLEDLVRPMTETLPRPRCLQITGLSSWTLSAGWRAGGKGPSTPHHTSRLRWGTPYSRALSVAPFWAVPSQKRCLLWVESYPPKSVC